MLPYCVLLSATVLATVLATIMAEQQQRVPTIEPTMKPTVKPTGPTYMPSTATPSAPTVFVDYSCLHAQYMQMNCNNDKNSRVTGTPATEYTAATYTSSSSSYLGGSTYQYSTTGIPYYNHTVTACDMAYLYSRPHKSAEYNSLKISTGSVVSFASDIGYSCSATTTDTTTCACIGSSTSSDYDSYCNSACASCTPASYYTSKQNMDMCNLYYWPPGPACPETQTATLTIPLKPRKNTKTASSSGCYVPLGQQGYLANGVSWYSWFDGASYDSLDKWHQIAAIFEIYDFDFCRGHADISNTYHHHTFSDCLAETFGDSGYGHSPVYGFARDGFPMYGPWQSSGNLAQSCWKKRDYSGTASKAGGWGCGTGRRTCVLDDPFNPTTVTILTSTYYGPNTNHTVYSMSGQVYTAYSGSYWEDFYYDTTCGTSGGVYLDANNGHDHDDLGWHYHITVDSSNTPVFPFGIGPQFYGMLGSADSDYCCDAISSSTSYDCATNSNYNSQVAGTGLYTSTDSCTVGFTQSTISSSSFHCSATMSKSTYVDHFCVPTIAPTGPTNVPSLLPTTSSSPTKSPTGAPVSSSPTSLTSGSIKTVAGTGATSFTGDNNAATSASLYNPVGVALDSSGNIYIADRYNNRIRKVTVSTGIMSTIAGTGTSSYSGDNGAATSATLNNPYGVSLDSSNNVYVADFSNNRIRKITILTGIISTIAGTGTASYSGDNGAATSATLNGPFGVALDSSGNVYISDRSNNRVRKVTVSTGIISTIAGTGTSSYSGDNGAATSATLSSPCGIALDSSNNVYIADKSNSRIRKVTVSTGIISTIAGSSTSGSFSGDNGAATSATLNGPFGVALDSSGNVYIADFSNNRVRMVTVSTGIISTIAGTGTASYSGDGGAATSATLYSPSGVAVDSSLNVYIADTYNHRVRQIANVVPTASPSSSSAPTFAPSRVPTLTPSAPTLTPSRVPTVTPSRAPTVTPSAPTVTPSRVPTVTPSSAPTVTPSRRPTTSTPSRVPTVIPTFIPDTPTFEPSTAVPTYTPTNIPSPLPSELLPLIPTALPSVLPTASPTVIPSSIPSFSPSSQPTTTFTDLPTIKSTTNAPTFAPTLEGDENVVFSLDQVLTGISLTDWSRDKHSESVFKSTVSTVTGIDASAITIDGVEEYVSTNIKRLKLRKLAGSGILIEYSIEFVDNVDGDDDYKEHAESVSNMILSSLKSGDFTQILQETARASNDTYLISAESNTIGFEHTNPEILSNDADNKPSKKSDPSGMIAGVVISILIIVSTGCAYYMYLQNKQKRKEDNALKDIADIDCHNLSYDIYGDDSLGDSQGTSSATKLSNVEMTSSSIVQMTNPMSDKRSSRNEDVISSSSYVSNPLLAMKINRITLRLDAERVKPPALSAAPITRISVSTLKEGNHDHDDDDDDEKGPRYEEQRDSMHL